MQAVCAGELASPRLLTEQPGREWNSSPSFLKQRSVAAVENQAWLGHRGSSNGTQPAMQKGQVWAAQDSVLSLSL